MESVIKMLANVGNFTYPNGIEKGNTTLHAIIEILPMEELEETEEESTEEQAESCCVRHSH
jgi:hypothetical protein